MSYYQTLRFFRERQEKISSFTFRTHSSLESCTFLSKFSSLFNRNEIYRESVYSFFFQYREARKLSSSTWIETQIGYRTVHGISMSHPARITNHPPSLVAAAITLIAMLRDICLSSRAEREKERKRASSHARPRPISTRSGMRMSGVLGVTQDGSWQGYWRACGRTDAGAVTRTYRRARRFSSLPARATAPSGDDASRASPSANHPLRGNPRLRLRRRRRHSAKKLVRFFPRKKFTRKVVV